MLGLGKAATTKDSVLNILSRKNSLLLLLLSLILLIVVIVVNGVKQSKGTLVWT